MNRGSSDVGRSFGVAFSTARGRTPVGGGWRFWYLQRSKRVWFRLSDPGLAARPLLFRFDGRAILHHSERAAWRAGDHGGPAPVLWRKWPGLGLAAGPRGSQLFLSISSRWSWRHPGALGHPERFSVEPLRP